MKKIILGLTIGLLLFLSIIALILDIIIFTEGKIFYYEENNEKFKNDNVVNTISSNSSMPVKTINSQISSSIIFNKYKDINDIIINKIREFTDKNYNKKTSVNVYIN